MKGIAHQAHRQQNFGFAFKKSDHRFSHGGTLFQKRLGRGQRPLSSKQPLHLVFKARRERIQSGSLREPQNFKLIHQILRRYSKKFFVKIDQLSIQGDHIHILIRTHRRSFFHSFFRVVAGQIAQRFQSEGFLKTSPLNKRSETPVSYTPRRQGTRLWKHRPFSRVVRGWRAYRIVRDYIQLNEQEVRGRIPYRKERLSGLSSSDWEILWT